jgi:cytochrome c553
MTSQRTVWVGLCVAGVALALAALQGPQLWGYWRFTQVSKAETAEIARVPVSSLAETCFICHGDRGRSRSEFYPNLAGQKADYLNRALDEMGTGQRLAPGMAPLARALTADQRLALANWFARQAPPPLQRAGPHATAACGTCHGARLEGDPATGAPRLSGLGWNYVARQIERFGKGERGAVNSPMRGVALALALDATAMAQLKRDWPKTDPLP